MKEELPVTPEVLGEEDASEAEDAPVAFGAHLGGVGSVMLLAWDDDEHRFIALALQVVERTHSGLLVFEPPDAEWLVLLERDYDAVCLTAQVGGRFVTVEGTVESVIPGPQPRVIIAPTSQTFWDTISKRVARVASDVSNRRRSLDDAASPVIPYEYEGS